MRWIDRLRRIFRRGGDPPPTRSPGQTTTPGADEASVMALVNDARRATGLGALAVDGRLAAAAQGHAADMARSGRLSHDGFPERLRAAGFGGSVVGEVVAQGQTTAAQVVGDWLGHPPHAAQLLGAAYAVAGVGRAENYWCVDFGGG